MYPAGDFNPQSAQTPNLPTPDINPEGAHVIIDRSNARYCSEELKLQFAYTISIVPLMLHGIVNCLSYKDGDRTPDAISIYYTALHCPCCVYP